MKYLKLFEESLPKYTEASKIDEGRNLNDDEKLEIRHLFSTFFDQPNWSEAESFNAPDSGISYHIQDSNNYIFDSESDEGKPTKLSKNWDGKEIHRNDRAMHGSQVINIMFGKEYTKDQKQNIYNEVQDFLEDLIDYHGYTGYAWKPSSRNIRIHISTKEANRFLKRSGKEDEASFY